ncbi:MAG: 3-phosphoshikimate 1-carboxyvinyltransferase [Bacteroidetes bacterium]|jgi:3-phosphoshikimate 1-carboxyvinyltransferase|nr:3-phosphoshikimate 1-carboxyvinyltransferase [Bacteroidota bacterium]MBT6686429.1 3-phosphoshikimate 1-carboxyvinyltransferase [Bacteroidota bacterium]MBT7144668.1 3-phosphoshikimate 1-carboxyvinyltransferase [Bacteroidota bacterium]MBT7491297.1 3-phosphoshikimate 1-carboxyvinyltransferase [Bacteroidota bacterium]
MKKKIIPSKINGTITAPASKSHLIRAITAAILANGKSIIKNPTFCHDTVSALNIAKNLGAKITKKKNEIFIEGNFHPKKNTIDAGESGLCLRMFSAIAALCETQICITGKGSLMSRPVFEIEKTLAQFGAECRTKNGYLPVFVKGRLNGGTAKLDGSQSSQFLTGLLFALPLLKSNSELIVENLKSKPYIDLTISVLNDFGIKITHNNYKLFKIRGNQLYHPKEFNVEGDWSGAAFLIVAGALGGNLQIENLNINSKQADIKILEAVKMAGAKIITNRNNIEVKKDKLNAFEMDASDCPDLFPPLVALAANCSGTTILHGADRLIHKESNRAASLKNEFEKLGIKISTDGNIMKIEGGEIIGGKTFSHNDHRIAMALAVAAIRTKAELEINDCSCVSKSYPAFFENFQSIGGNIIQTY